MAGLKRIILIDTHLPGVVELKLDGHTNICGTNASGKTTLQRLIVWTQKYSHLQNIS